MRAIHRERSFPRPLSVFHPCSIRRGHALITSEDSSGRGLTYKTRVPWAACPPLSDQGIFSGQLRARNPLPGQHLRPVAGAKRSGAPVSATWAFAPLSRQPPAAPPGNTTLPGRLLIQSSTALAAMRWTIRRYSLCTDRRTTVSKHLTRQWTIHRDRMAPTTGQEPPCLHGGLRDGFAPALSQPASFAVSSWLVSEVRASSR